MTSLREFLTLNFHSDITYDEITMMTNAYIKELEEHMGRANPQFSYSIGYDMAVYKMLKFLKGEDGRVKKET